MKSLSDASVFKYAEMMGSHKITNSIKALINEKQGAIFITEENLEDVLYQMRHKSFNYSGKFSVIDLFRKGVIRLVYNNKVKLTVAVPFFKYKMPTGGYGVIVNISNYAKVDEDGKVKIDPLVLYTLMLSGAFSLVESSHVSLLANNGLVDFYAELIVAVLAKVINMDLVKRDTYKFIFGKFFLMQMGINEDRAASGAKSLTKLDDATIENIDLSCPIAVFDNLETLITHLKTIFNDMNNVTLGILFDKWMRSYGESTGFALENISMFIMLFVSLITNCNNLVNIKSIEKNANKHSSKLIVLFNKIETAVSEIH